MASREGGGCILYGHQAGLGELFVYVAVDEHLHAADLGRGHGVMVTAQLG